MKKVDKRNRNKVLLCTAFLRSDHLVSADVNTDCQSMSNVLVADDDAGSLQLMRHILERARHQVFLARDAETALGMARSIAFDCIILDDNMPRHTGAQLCRAVREQSANPNAPVLLISAGLRINDPAYVASSGATAVIRKPCLPADVVRIITRALSAPC